jgi:hypothetical protein
METNNEIIPVEESNWRVKVLVIGGLIGAAAGLGAAYLYVQRASDLDIDEAPEVTPMEGIKLSLIVFTALRQIAQLGSGK